MKMILFKIVNIDNKGVEAQLTRLNHLVEQVMLQSGMTVDMDDIPGITDDPEIERVFYSDERAELIAEQLRKSGRTPR